MDEEKTIDEAVEQADEMKEFEPVAFDEVIKETEPERKDAPVLRDGGDPEPADMNMIHKHVDNFLAMLCGETPIDDNVRTSTEYWLKRLADGEGGSTKKLYYHPIVVVNTTSAIINFCMAMIIINTDPTAYNSGARLTTAIADFNRIAPICGSIRDISNSATIVTSYATKQGSVHNIVGLISGSATVSNNLSIETLLSMGDTIIVDNVNAIN